MSCEIILDKTSYVAGENLTGRVEIANSQPMTIRCKFQYIYYFLSKVILTYIFTRRYSIDDKGQC